MTARTRRRLISCLVVLALTVPVESVLLQAVSTNDARTAAIEWAASLSPDGLSAAADHIQQFPFYLRRGIMKALSPEKRSAVWRAVISGYIDSRPDLPAAAVDLLQGVSDLATPENLSSPSAEARAQIKSIAEQLVAIIGKDETEYALYRLGPRDGTFQSLEPASLKLSNWVRNKLVAIAAAISPRDCDCNVNWGCDGGASTQCRANTGCTPDDSWPACGWLWNETCDGSCTVLMGG